MGACSKPPGVSIIAALMTENAVVIAGGGPTGLVLAGELALAGTDVVVVEPRPGPEVEGSRAGGLHARTIELLEQRGIAQRFLDAGTAMQISTFAGVPLDLSAFPTRHPYSLALPQAPIERLLTAWVGELGLPFLREREVVGLAQDDDGVDVALSNGTTRRAPYLVGCDGGRSVVRKAAGIAFEGWDASVSTLIDELSFTETPPWGVRYDARGTHGFGPLDDGARARLADRGLRRGLRRPHADVATATRCSAAASPTSRPPTATAASCSPAASGEVRHVSSFLHTGRPVLLDLGALPPTDRVPHVRATADGPWAVPALGEVPAPHALLVRPDGHVAWVGDGTDDGLDEALTTWFGAGIAA